MMHAYKNLFIFLIDLIRYYLVQNGLLTNLHGKVGGFLKKYAPCGDDCTFCLSYIGTKENDMELLKKMAKILYEIGWRDKILHPDLIKCEGCSIIAICEYGIKECCEEKQIENCGCCEEYPCSKNKVAFEKNELDIKKCRNLLSDKDFEMFKKAYFSKKENLSRKT